MRQFGTQNVFFEPPREFGFNPDLGYVDPHQLLLLAIERALAPPVVHARSTLQPMRVIVVGPNSFAQPDITYEAAPEPRVLLPHVLGTSSHREPRFHQRLIQGEILSDENGKLFEKLGSRIREVHQLASSSSGDLIELVPAGDPKLRLIGPTTEPKVVEPHDAGNTSSARASRVAQHDSQKSEFIPLSSENEKSPARTHRKLFADPGQWRVVWWGEFKEILSAQLANPERLRDRYRLPCYVQVFETERAVTIEELAAAYKHENGRQTPLYFLTDELAAKLDLTSLLPAVAVQSADQQRAPGSLLPHERVFRLLVANDPTVDVGSMKRSQTSETKSSAVPEVREGSENTSPPALKQTIPDRFIKNREFRISRDEALYDMNTKPTLLCSLIKWLGRLRFIQRRNQLRKWQSLLAGKSTDEQLWAVRPPSDLRIHRVVNDWVIRTLALGGYDPNKMLTEWEIFWRRKG